MLKIYPYLNYNGTCEEAFELYRMVLGGHFHYVSRYKDMPADDQNPIAPELADKIMHISLQINEHTILMGSDAGGEWAGQITSGNQNILSVSLDSKNETDRVFALLSEGGEISMPLNQTFWGDYFGMFTDRFGIHWMLSYTENKNS